MHLDEGREHDVELPCEPLREEPERGPLLKGTGIDQMVADVAEILSANSGWLG